uniref:Uncharacterized protein n=1 Tax=Inkyuleea mariana TaxID=123988 RepID=A0A4D6X2E2_9FLOR|nr:hypothetical protein [Inkyuleea mariana]
MYTNCYTLLIFFILILSHSVFLILLILAYCYNSLLLSILYSRF